MTTFATLEELKDALTGTGGVSPKMTNDSRLQGLLNELSDFFVDETNRSFDPNPPLDDSGEDTAEDAVVTLHIGRHRVIPVPDARVLTSVSLNGGSPLAVGRDYETLAQNGVVVGLILHRHHGHGQPVTLTGRFGIWPIPAAANGAVIEMAARAYKSQDARYGDVVALPDGGSVSYFKTLPARAQATIDNYSLAPNP